MSNDCVCCGVGEVLVLDFGTGGGVKGLGTFGVSSRCGEFGFELLVVDGLSVEEEPVDDLRFTLTIFRSLIISSSALGGGVFGGDSLVALITLLCFNTSSLARHMTYAGMSSMKGYICVI